CCSRLSVGWWKLTVQCVEKPETRTLPASDHHSPGGPQKVGRLGLRKPLVPEQLEQFAIVVFQEIDVSMKIGPSDESCRIERPQGLSRNRVTTRATASFGAVADCGARSLAAEKVFT